MRPVSSRSLGRISRAVILLSIYPILVVFECPRLYVMPEITIHNSVAIGRGLCVLESRVLISAILDCIRCVCTLDKGSTYALLTSISKTAVGYLIYRGLGDLGDLIA